MAALHTITKLNTIKVALSFSEPNLGAFFLRHIILLVWYYSFEDAIINPLVTSAISFVRNG